MEGELKEFPFEEYDNPLSREADTEEAMRFAKNFLSVKNKETEKIKITQKEFAYKNDPQTIMNVARNPEKAYDFEKICQPSELRNIRHSEFSQYMASLIYQTADREVIVKFWHEFRKLFPKDTTEKEKDNYQQGIQGVVTAVLMLEELEFKFVFPHPIEDAFKAIDLYAQHPENPDIVFAVHIKSSDEMPNFYISTDCPWFSPNERAAGKEDKIAETKRLKEYVEALNLFYQNKKFYPLFITCPTFQSNSEEIQESTGVPSRSFLKKFAKNDKIVKILTDLDILKI